MTAGILVCCMPTTAAVIRHWKYPISSFLTPFRRLIRPRSFVHLEDHAKLSPASDLRPCRRHPPDIRGAMALVENGGSGSGPPSLDCSQNNSVLSLIRTGTGESSVSAALVIFQEKASTLNCTIPHYD